MTDEKKSHFTAGFQVAISSTNRVPSQGSTDCDFIYIIPNFPQQNNFNRVTITDLVIPAAWYLVNNGQNTFTLMEGANSTIVTIPQGNYYRAQFLTVISNLLTTASTAMGHNFVYVASAPNTSTQGETYINIITVSMNAGVQPIIIIPNNTTIGQVMGLNENTSNQFVSNVLTPPNICSFSLEWSIYLHSDCVALDGDDILCPIFNAAVNGNGAAVIYKAAHPFLSAKRFIPRPTSGFRFWVTDEDNNLMNTRGLNVNFILFFFRVEEPQKLIESKIDELIRLLKMLLEKANTPPPPIIQQLPPPPLEDFINVANDQIENPGVD